MAPKNVTPSTFHTTEDLAFNPYDDPEYAHAERDYEQEQWDREHAWYKQGLHHPDCCCNQCYLGDDANKWLHSPSEY